MVEGAADVVVAAKGNLNLTGDPGSSIQIQDIGSNDSALVEATLAPRTHMAGRSLREIQFRDRYGFTALAIRRQGEIITQRLREVPLQFGDTLLLQGPTHRLEALQDGDEFLVLEPIELSAQRREKAPIAVGVLVLVVSLVILAGFSISTAMVIGSVLLVLSGTLTMDEAYESIDWRTVFLVAGMLPLGTAMEATGTASYIANLLLGALGSLGPLAMLAGIYILAALVTQPMSNAAAMVLIVPIAADTALSLGANHLTFTMATVIGAATSFLTPVGHKANVLVFGPGGYRFFDYTRVGTLLTIFLLMIVSMIFIPIIWPLFP